MVNLVEGRPGRGEGLRRWEKWAKVEDGREDKVLQSLASPCATSRSNSTLRSTLLPSIRSPLSHGVNARANVDLPFDQGREQEW